MPKENEGSGEAFADAKQVSTRSQDDAGPAVTIRLLDPPPQLPLMATQAELAKSIGVSLQTVKDRVASLQEFSRARSRGCRLGVTSGSIACRLGPSSRLLAS